MKGKQTNKQKTTSNPLCPSSPSSVTPSRMAFAAGRMPSIQRAVHGEGCVLPPPVGHPVPRSHPTPGWGVQGGTSRGAVNMLPLGA